jgi:hypothetical protein
MTDIHIHIHSEDGGARIGEGVHPPGPVSPLHSRAAYVVRRKDMPGAPARPAGPTVQLPASFYRPLPAEGRPGVPPTRVTGGRHRNRDRAGKFTFGARSESDVQLTNAAGADDQLGGPDDSTLPDNVQDFCAAHPGWSDLMVDLMRDLRVIAPAAKLHDVSGNGRRLRITAVTASGSDEQVGAQLRARVDLTEMLAPTICPDCGQARPLHGNCQSQLCADDWS